MRCGQIAAGMPEDSTNAVVCTVFLARAPCPMAGVARSGLVENYPDLDGMLRGVTVTLSGRTIKYG
jgi:hypothetical protein